MAKIRPFFACDCGVRQGENLSPVLFAIYLNDLETYLLHKNLSGVTIDIPDGDIQLYLKLFSLLYADDTIIMAENPSDFQQCLQAFSEYCTEWKLTINVGKTKIIIFGSLGIPNLNFTIGGEKVEIVKSYKYLGVLLSQNGSFLSARKHVVQQAKKAMYLLFTRINNLDIPLDLQLKLFDNTVVPILTYGSEVWGYENLDRIETVHNDFLRKITRSKKSTPLYMLLGEPGRLPLRISIKARMVGYWNRLIHGKNTKLSLLLYKCLRLSHIRSNWLTCIKNIFSSIGRPDIWELQQDFYMTNLSSHVKSILRDQYLQEWRGEDSDPSKALNYFSFKSEHKLETYLISLPRNQYLNLFKFRTGNHKLPVEVGRWDDTDLNDRQCILCNADDIGDEYHYLLKCPIFHAQRQSHLKQYYIRRPNMLKFGELLKSENLSILTKLSKFTKIIMDTFK